jgi:NADH-quinone oxidoreductase subunit M
MLIAILMLYFASDLSVLSAQRLAELGVADAEKVAASTTPVHTFNIQALQHLGQKTDQFNEALFWGATNGWWIFLLLFVGFLVKVPGVPFHTWLPDAHVEAPTPISMLLAGVLLKLGGYGILRLCYPVCPIAAHDLAPLVCAIGIISMVYGAFAAMAATDFKRLVAYSSVSHMGYVVLGLGAWSVSDAWSYNWSYGVSGAMFQMIAHGISSAGMFFMVGVLYDRVHHRNLDQFGGVMDKMPLYGGLAAGIFFAGLGLPGLCGFIGEVMVTLSVWNYSRMLAVIAASVVLLTAGYILWTLQRVYLGGDYKGPHGEALDRQITPRELSIAVPLLSVAILFGVYPDAVLRVTGPSVDQMVEQLTEVEKARQANADSTVLLGQSSSESSEMPEPDSKQPGPAGG